ncbi:hypothetical protein AA313_de0206126 [Arthrobotrys entomopaga]|nr:hypothetical protein AA313_de0206126 [Arthrobotrys entomopaga]
MSTPEGTLTSDDAYGHQLFTESTLLSDFDMIISHNEEGLKNLVPAVYSGRIINKEISTICTGFPKLYESSRFSDIEIVVGPNETTFHAHCAILCEKSSFFDKSLKKLAEYPTTIKLPTCHAETFEVILRYLYTGEIKHSQHPGMVARLYKDANFLGIPEIKEHVLSLFLEKISFESIQVDDWEVYVIGMVRGLAESIDSSHGWKDATLIFNAVVEMRGFESWVNSKKFMEMLDENAIPARMMLQKLVLKNRRTQESIRKDYSEKIETIQDDANAVRDALTLDLAEKENKINELDGKNGALEEDLKKERDRSNGLQSRVEELERELAQKREEIEKLTPKE